mmetsp:Transcript_81121/g.160770  ORF Transcript_81121/g.160770 Transcript_81121/m.160770 type:complete len:467 (-) Transcript_81121:209-1609(-)
MSKQLSQPPVVSDATVVRPVGLAKLAMMTSPVAIPATPQMKMSSGHLVQGLQMKMVSGHLVLGLPVHTAPAQLTLAPAKPVQVMSAKSMPTLSPVWMQAAQQAKQGSGVHFTDGPQQLFTANLKLQDKLVGVMVTISQGTSYDENFREVEPTTVPGERISTYLLQCCEVQQLHDFLRGTQPLPTRPAAWSQLLDDIQRVPADSVTFNWECCSFCSDKGFPSSVARFGSSQVARAPSATMQLAGLAVQQGFTVMFSDFSLKALLAEWSEDQLGPNPFMQLQTHKCNHKFVLDFLPSELRSEEVPQQLQVVGELCSDRGRAAVAAMGDTIVYTLNPRRVATQRYEVKVLTVASEIVGCPDIPEAVKCSVGSSSDEKRGAAGHVTLTYESGGQLITSMGHWIELTRLDTSERAVMEVAGRSFGMQKQMEFQTEMNTCYSAQERSDCVQRWSKTMVQQSMPSRMKQRTKF